ncbi:hypothetical protein AeRB84_010894 [Aphanomyces euteiches]|nr:hypothetical protein AeRB84_010894 [Aphanomyces euteiches]
MDVARDGVRDFDADAGISCFSSKHEVGFTGRIKERPEDFQVQEVTLDGTVVDLVDPNDAIDEVAAAPTSTKKTSVTIEVSEPEEGWKSFLNAALGQATVESIDQIVHETIPSIELPTPEDLKDKVKLLKAIQHCFPGVESKNAKDDYGKSLIKLSLDPLFLKLRKGGLPEEDCNRILKFLLQGPFSANAEDGVALSDDMTKEQRTLAHRLVASSSSCLVTKTVGNNVHVFFSPKTLQRRKRKLDTFLRCTLRKTNVDHFSALDILARALRASVTDFSVAGTKDKRAITTQHLVMKNVTPDTIQKARPTLFAAGIEIGQLQFVEQPLSLGQSQGNRFTLRIRDIDVGRDVVAQAMTSVIECGCINYFGHQRVGDLSVPVRTYHIGLALMQQKWEQAVRLLFSQTQVNDLNLEAKTIFLATDNIQQALKDLPEKCVNERAVLMGLRRHGSTEFKKALGQIPYHRRIMYLHACQSVLFNRMASLRMEAYGSKVVVGDLILDKDNSVRVVEQPDDEDIFNVVLPLVGTKAQFPTHDMGIHYSEHLKEIGVDPSAWTQDWSVKGAYRRFLCRPTELTWQFDEATKVVSTSFQLPPGSFATILLREIMKSHPKMSEDS